MAALIMIIRRAILKHGTDRTGPDRTNTLIRGTDRTDRGVVMGVFLKLAPYPLEENLVRVIYDVLYSLYAYVVKSIDRDQVIIHRMSHLC